MMNDRIEIPDDWEIRKIGNLGGNNPTTVQTGPFGAQLHAEDYVEEGIPFILIRNFGEHGLNDSEMPRISEQDAKRLERYALEPGDIVFSRVGRIGSCFLVEANQRGWIISGQLLRIRLPESMIHTRYLIRALQSWSSQQYIANIAVGSTRKSLNTQILEELKIPLPTRFEQEYIAKLFETMDRNITQTEQLIEKLRSIKSGLLNDLLTRGIGEDGHVRTPEEHSEEFKDSEVGQIPTIWKLYQLENLAEIKMGQSPPGTSYNSEERGLPFFQGNADFGDRYPSIRLYTTNPLKTANRDDILISVRAPVGKINLSPCECSIGRGLASIHSKSESLSQTFLYYTFDHSTVKLNRVEEGSTFKAIKKSDLERFRIGLPPLDEQAAIIDILEGSDTRIRIENQYLEKLKMTKSGLMNDLLTGQVRVKVPREENGES